jgi:hypothetical protein
MSCPVARDSHKPDSANTGKGGRVVLFLKQKDERFNKVYKANQAV